MQVKQGPEISHAVRTNDKQFQVMLNSHDLRAYRPLSWALSSRSHRRSTFLHFF